MHNADMGKYFIQVDYYKDTDVCDE